MVHRTALFSTKHNYINDNNNPIHPNNAATSTSTTISTGTDATTKNKKLYKTESTTTTSNQRNIFNRTVKSFFLLLLDVCCRCCTISSISVHHRQRSIVRKPMTAMTTQQPLSVLIIVVLLIVVIILFFSFFENSRMDGVISILQFIITNTNTSTKTIKQQPHSPLLLYYLPLQPFHSCNGSIQKVVCSVTYLIHVEYDSDPISFPILDIDSNSYNNNKNTVCEELLIPSSSPMTSSVSDTAPVYVVLEVPVCVQNSYGFGAIVHYSTSDNDNNDKDGDHNQLQFVQTKQISDNGTTIHTLFHKLLPSSHIARSIVLKYIDFPGIYEFVSNGSEPEYLRDSNYGNMVWRYASHKIINPITVNHHHSYKLSNGSRDKNYDKVNTVDALVIANANLLQLKKTPSLQGYVTSLTHHVIARNVSTVVLGLGVQAEFDDINNEVNDNANNDKNEVLVPDTNITNNTDNDNTTASSGTGTSTSTSTRFEYIVPSMMEQILLKHSKELILPFSFQKDFLTEISKRQSKPAIGVRGDITAAVCSNSNIYHCISMGCPSLTISRDSNLGYTMETNWNTVIKNMLQQSTSKTTETTSTIRIALATPGFHLNKRMGYLVFELYSYILLQYGYENVTFLVQATADSKQMKSYLSKVWNVQQASKQNKTLSTIDWNKIKFRDYNNVESWLDSASKDYDVCISARIHGTMPFISSGIPVIAIPTDFRIMELLLSMKIPYVSPSKVYEIIQSINSNSNDKNSSDVRREGEKEQYIENDIIFDLFQNAEQTNFTLFELNRRNKINGWKDILDEAGLEMDPSLLKIIHYASMNPI